MTPDETIEHCNQRIKLLGAGAKVFVKMFGRWGATDTRRMGQDGPTGQVSAELWDGKNILVAFSAAEVKTYLEVKKHGNFTGRIGD